MPGMFFTIEHICCHFLKFKSSPAPFLAFSGEVTHLLFSVNEDFRPLVGKVLYHLFSKRGSAQVELIAKDAELHRSPPLMHTDI